MGWYSIRQNGIELNRVFVMTEADLNNQLSDGKTAVKVDSPLLSPPVDK